MEVYPFRRFYPRFVCSQLLISFQNQSPYTHFPDYPNLRSRTSLTAAISNPLGNNYAGLPTFSHSPQRSHSLLPLRHRYQPSQSRLRRRSQRHRIPYPLRPPSVLHPIHWLHSIQASAPRTAATSALVPRPCGNGLQHYRASVSGAFLYVLLLSDSDAGPAGYNELEYCYVRGNFSVGY